MVERIDLQQKLDCFVQCMKSLASADRRLLLRYYPLEDEQLEEKRLDLAASLNMPISKELPGWL